MLIVWRAASPKLGVLGEREYLPWSGECASAHWESSYVYIVHGIHECVVCDLCEGTTTEDCFAGNHNIEIWQAEPGLPSSLCSLTTATKNAQYSK